MEKKGEEFLKGSGDAATEKYVKRYREESARCVSEVAVSVKEAMKGNGVVKNVGRKSKRLKIWNDSDTEEDDSGMEDEMEKPTVSNNRNSSDSKGSLDSVTGGKQDGETSGRCSNDSCSEEEMVVHTVEESIHTEKNVMVEPLVQDEKMATSSILPGSAPDTVLGVEELVSQPQKQEVESTLIVSEANGSSESKPVVQEETVANGNTTEMAKLLNFDDFNSAAEMEVLGLERLKSELQARGLKCGGALKERAARLFMLKSTPIEKIPKKLLAKK